MTKTQRNAFISSAVLGFVLAYFSDKILYIFIPSGSSLALTSAVLRVLGHIILAASFAFSISIYIRHARIGSLTKRKIIIIALWLLWPVVMIAFNYAVYSSYKEFYQYMDKTFSDSDRNFTSKMNTELPGEKKSRMTYIHAQSIYRHQGKITEYQSLTGTAISYIPSEEDIEVRRSITFMQAHNNSLGYVMMSSSIAYLLSFLGMIYFGFAEKPGSQVI
jgi:hypothetical protein